MPKRLGQHFLTRKSILERIANAVSAIPESLIVEIGAGRGALTEPLLSLGGRVVAIELDSDLAAYLQRRFRDEPRLTIVHANVLDVDLRQWGPAIFTGNLPYYITSPVIDKVLTLGDALERAVFLVQEEVAERLTAQPGSRDYGYLTVRTRLYANPEILFRVPASAFKPPPKVTSAVVRLTPCASPAVADPARFVAFLGACFRQKRKTLRNNLAGTYGKEVFLELPEASLRAEQLALDQLHSLYQRLEGSR